MVKVVLWIYLIHRAKGQAALVFVKGLEQSRPVNAHLRTFLHVMCISVPKVEFPGVEHRSGC